jgi:predicted nuclease with TOPRIM domain
LLPACCVQLVENQQLVHDLRLQLGTLQGNHRETLDQLSEKSKQIVLLKAELERISNQNSSMAEEVRSKHWASYYDFKLSGLLI